MNNMLKSASVAGVLLAVGIGGLPDSRAAEPQFQKTQVAQVSPQAPKGTAAKVIIVDRSAKAITVDIHGTIHLLWLGNDAKIRKDGKDATIADITPGQTVNFVTRKTARGEVEIVMELTIESNDTGSEAAGNGKAIGKTSDKGAPPKAGSAERDPVGDPGRGTPPLFAPPPVTRPVVSPHN